jgi:hypothetical protein
MSRFVLLLMLMFLVSAGLAPSVAAGEEACDDPPVLIVTPSGQLVVVYVTTYADIEHLIAITLAEITWEVRPEGPEATRVTMHVTVPDDVFAQHFEARTVVSTGPFATGTIYDTASGYSGEPMKLEFRLDVP